MIMLKYMYMQLKIYLSVWNEKSENIHLVRCNFDDFGPLKEQWLVSVAAEEELAIRQCSPDNNKHLSPRYL